MPGHCESLCTGPSGSVKTIFSILHEKPGLVKKLAERLQISCPLRRRSAHLDGRRRDPDTWKWPFFVWSVTGSLFPTSKRKTAAVWPQGDQGGDEDDLGWGQAFWYQGPVRRRLTAVVGAYWKVGSDRQYICAKFRENTFLCTSNSFCFISSVAFDFDFTSYLLFFFTAVSNIVEEIK